MPEGLSDYGEQELLTNGLVGKTVNVTLYDDQTDQLTDSDGTGAITTDPSGGTTTKTITIQSSDISQVDGDYRFERDVTFGNLSGAGGRIDAVAVSEDGTTDILFRGLLEDDSGADTPITDIGPVDKIDPLTVPISLD